MTANASRQVQAATQRRQTLSIGQVLAKLTPEFPDLSPSKLRFLEDRELITPGRTPAGYRTYTAEDVERLRFVLTVQRDHYLPLKVIKGYVDELDKGKKPALPNGSPISQAVTAAKSARYTKAELLVAASAKPATLEGAVSAGLIDAKTVYSSQDLVVLRTILEAAAFGLEPRHLRGMRLAVDREVGLISQAVSASNGGKISPTELREKGRELSEILTTLRGVLTKDALERLES
jgi:DNA-binding transcriptional MerR regulator